MGSTSKPHDEVATPFAAATAVTNQSGRQRGLEQAAVTEKALAIVDRDGLGGLTMRRIADQLGVGLATLYGAAGSKEAILHDMVDTVLAELPDADRTSGHEYDALIELWAATHELLVAHPAVAQLAALQPVGGTGLYGLVESTLELLRAGGVEEDSVVTAYQTLRSYAFGFTLLRISRSGPLAEQERKRRAEMTNLPPEEFPEVADLAPALASPMSSEQFLEGLAHLLKGFMPRYRPRSPAGA